VEKNHPGFRYLNNSS